MESSVAASDLSERILSARPFLLPALELDGLHREEDVILEIQRGNAHLWSGEKSAAVTCVQRHPKGDVLRIWLAGGDLDELRDKLLPMIETWGAFLGCDMVAICGRRGWVRALRDQGYEEVHTTVSKALENGQ